MKRLSPSFKWAAPILFVLLSFAVGLWWGHSHYLSLWQRRFQVQDHLVILTYRELWPQDLVEDFLLQSHTEIQFDFADTEEELWQKFSAQPQRYHLLVLLNNQVAAAQKVTHLQTISTADWGTLVAPDFLQMAADSEGRTIALPIFWGVNGLAVRGVDQAANKSLRLEQLFTQTARLRLLYFPANILSLFPAGLDVKLLERPSEFKEKLKPVVRFFPPPRNPVTARIAKEQTGQYDVIQMSNGEFAFFRMQDKNSKWTFSVPENAALWTLNVAIPDTPKKALAAEFVQQIGRLENAARMTRASQLASPLLAFEGLAVDRHLKPSFLRQVPLHQIHIYRGIEHSLAVDLQLRSMLAELN